MCLEKHPTDERATKAPTGANEINRPLPILLRHETLSLLYRIELCLSGTGYAITGLSHANTGRSYVV